MSSARQGMGRAERDLVTLGVAIAAVILFIGNGGAVIPQVILNWLGEGPGPDIALTNALLLNIALIIFGWRRYNELMREVAERREAEAKARELAAIDPLTNCLNRRSLGEATERLIAEAQESGGAVAQLMIDLDNFKQVNDLNGHRTGDAVLKEVASRIVDCLPEDALVARIGGDEFCCAVAFDPQSPERIEQIASRLIDQVGRPIEIDGICLDTTVSVGMARTGTPAEEDCSEAESLLHRADIAMYHAKKQGRNRYAWYEVSMESELRFRNQLETGIRQGIPKGEFVPYYQQQVDLSTGKLVGFEMLARWNSPKFGMVGPEIFIPIAEEIGVISDLSESVIRQALEDAKAWDPVLTLAINISPLQLRDPWFAQKLVRLLTQTGFPPERLEIEITESCLHENIGAVRNVVSSLKNMGIHISLDDFGTGYSSLSQLQSLPFDRIKIDRSFVRDLKGDESMSKVVEAIISLSNGLEMPITAEGIESFEIHDLLKGMGDMKGQGFLYGRPESAAATLQRLAKESLLLDKGQVEFLEDERLTDDAEDFPEAGAEQQKRAS